MNKERLKGLAAGLTAGILSSQMMGLGATVEAATTCDWSHPLTEPIPASSNEQILKDVSREYVQGDITFVGHPEKPDNDPDTFQVVYIELPVNSELKVIAPWGGTRFKVRECATTGQFETLIGHQQRLSQLGRPENQPTVSWTINRP
jgi:hypothetical protein